MSDVTFAIGSRPRLPAAEADDLARLIELARNAPALELAARIRQEARRRDERATVNEIELDAHDLEQIGVVFVGGGPDLLRRTAFAHLHRELLAALTG